MTNVKAVFEQLLHCKVIVTDEDMYYYVVPYDVYKDICNVLKEHENCVSIPFDWLVKFCTHMDFREPMSDEERAERWKEKLSQQLGVKCDDSRLMHDVLTKTEAITPIITQKEEDFRSELVDVYCCGNCRQELEQYPRKWNYCPICGNEVKWNDIR